MSLTVSLCEARAFLRRKGEARRLAGVALARQAAADSEAILALVVSQYRPEQVYQWGSLLKPEQFGPHSDIDLAVEGIADPETFFALYGDADRLTSFPLDLVAMKRIEPGFEELIRLKGRLAYERG